MIILKLQTIHKQELLFLNMYTCLRIKWIDTILIRYNNTIDIIKFCILRSIFQNFKDVAGTSFGVMGALSSVEIWAFHRHSVVSRFGHFVVTQWWRDLGLSSSLIVCRDLGISPLLTTVKIWAFHRHSVMSRCGPFIVTQWYRDLGISSSLAEVEIWAFHRH